jgi:hypothetical protein
MLLLRRTYEFDQETVFVLCMCWDVKLFLKTSQILGNPILITWAM